MAFTPAGQANGDDVLGSLDKAYQRRSENGVILAV
jgi:hypothetical protein